MATHTGAYEHICPKCGKGFTLKRTLTTHLQGHDREGKDWEFCTEGCKFTRGPNKDQPLSFGSEKAQKRHLAVKHGIGGNQDRGGKCQFCNKPFAYSSDVKRHEKWCASNPEKKEGPFKCYAYKCDKRVTEFPDPKSLDSHMRHCHPTEWQAKLKKDKKQQQQAEQPQQKGQKRKRKN